MVLYTVPEDTLYGTVERINEIFVEAEKVNFDTVFDALMGFLTFYLWFRLKESTYGKQLRILDEFIAQENHRKYRPLGLELTNPLDTGLRYILIRSL
ncbi:hypothetical protein SARC_01496 [Sphaeroforma arctica JP610]|uniref:Ras modification protein ERF4 n=1 Tax=Sphaeroforma arctica JP610 TaxID=667725 RepID=A0A0L0GBT1_9EUKA|nr:hypothetical protein SARC_01496 [Sphaeroforma arctica JP610]KNC86364.1 hypothetical protein SARC_01496 [Sphaeroforma arctica JP610]|eukprot:XP_014160266.1 hypothetical protein SARC_01496 [Sphaeroforma arctica JP610]